MNKVLALIFLFSSGLPVFSFAEELVCKNWLADNKIQSTDPKCVFKCSTSITDLGTSHCTGQCEEMCANFCKEFQLNWEKNFSENRPEGWPHSAEKSRPWLSGERKKIQQAISRLPPLLRNIKTAKIYRMNRSKDYPNEASHSKGIVVVYDIAFKSPRALERILAHELAHEVYEYLSNADIEDYKMKTNWFEHLIKGKKHVLNRGIGFVTEDGKTSPEEDFANNLEYYLFEPTRLKSVTPHAYQWNKEHFGDKFELGDKCEVK
jgi:hypothetical protein